MAQAAGAQHAKQYMAAANAHRVQLQRAVQPAALHGLVQLRRQVHHRGRACRQAVEGIDQVGHQFAAIELEALIDPAQVRVRLLQHQLKPVHQLNVGVTPQAAQAGGGFHGLESQVVEFSK